MPYTSRAHRLGPASTVALVLAGLAIVTLTANSSARQASADFYYFDSKPVPLVRSETEVVVRFADAVGGVKGLAQQTPGVQRSLQAGTGSRGFDVVSLPRLVTPGGPPPAARAAGEAVAQFLQTVRQDPNVIFAAPVYHYGRGGIRVLPTDELVVRLKPGDTEQDLANIIDGLGLTIDRPLEDTTDRYVLRMTDGKGLTALDLSRTLHEAGRLAWAEPNFIQQYQQFDIPNDPLYSNQWHLKNTGQGGGLVGADSKLEQAWDIEDGNGSIVIAVLDDGIEKTHEDLAATIFVNPGEIAANGVDDDGNGKIDDVNGWDFKNGDNNADPAGDDSHGTGGAGVAAARGNNGIGVTGACRQCRLLPIKISENGTFADNATIANAIAYAAQFADILNNSWGSGAPNAALQSAIATANVTGRGGKGTLSFFSTGNNASGIPTDPIQLVMNAGTYGFRFLYIKNGAGAAGDDTSWLSWVNFPGLGFSNFTNGIPAGWTTGGNQPWTVVTDPWRSDESLCLTKAAKAGTIGNNQTSYLQVYKTISAGNVVIQQWTSSEANLDGLKIQVDYFNNGTFFDTGFFASGIPGDGVASYTNHTVSAPVLYPAAHPESIAVGASSNLDCRSFYSQFGPEVTFLAPSDGNIFNRKIETTDRMGAAGNDPGNYMQASFDSGFGGTSSSSPFAAGIAALILSRSPGLTRAKVIDILKNSADKVGPEPYVAGRNDRYGHGRLNAYQALLNTPVVPGAPTNVVATGGNGQASVSFSAPASDGGSAITSYTVTSSPGGFTSSGASSPRVVSGLTNGVPYTFTVRATNEAGQGPASSASNSVIPSSGAPGAFGKTTPGNGAAGQPLATTLTWGASSGATGYEYCIDTSNNNACNATWISTGTATSVTVPALPASTAHYWHVRANGTTYAEGNSASFWSFTTAAASGPFGQVDTPSQNAAGVQGAIGVTGWALDDINVTKVEIFRNCLGFEPANCQTVLGQSVVYIGDAAFLAGARADVEAAFPTHPNKNRAGWGYLMLTPMLPHVTGSQPFGGQGALTIYAIATDSTGNKKILGRSSSPGDPTYSTPTSIGMTNDSIAKPFGAIDTPGQGQTISGMFNNFGWAITPDSNSTAGDPGDIVINPNGSTMTVFIDSNPVALVAYNQCRGNVGNPPPGGVYCNDDVANIFGRTTPAAPLTARTSNPTKFRNLDAARGAIGAYTFNTASYSNGLHTIAWSVSDSLGRNEGIGSRFFIVNNADAPLPSTMAPASRQMSGPAATLERHTRVSNGVWARTGFDLGAPWTRMQASDNGTFALRLTELGRMELWLGDMVDAGYMVANGRLQPLPIGSSLQGLRFGWMPPPGYIGPYHLVFVRGGERIDVHVTVVEKPRARAGEAQIRMQLDAVTSGAARVDQLGERNVRVQGWAFDPQAAIGPGITAVHVWARPEEGDAAAPLFLGAATLDEARPDAARAFAGASEHAGFSLTAALKPGTYILTAYAWNERTDRWEDARSVRVVVR